MPNVSKLNINDNEYVIVDNLAQENISTIVDVIQLNNEGVSLRLNDLNNRLEKIEDEDSKVISSSLNDLNDRLETIENGDFGEDNIIESITVNDTQIIPDANKNINISIKENVKSDWDATSGSDSEILNKPDLSNFITIETQPNWNETNTSSAAYIQNKPTIPDAQIQADWSQTLTTAKDYIKNKPNIQTNGNWVSRIMFGGETVISGDDSNGLTLLSDDEDINLNAGGKAYYNNQEIAVKTDIPTVPTTSTTVTQNDTNPVSGGAVYAKFEDLIGAAPAALDTLEEIADALNNDADLAGTLTTQISGKVPKVSNPTADNFASFNSDGTIKDSGHSHSDYITSIKTVNNESLVGTGNIVVSGLPAVTSADNGKILMVVNGQWQLVSPSVLYSGSGIPNNANGNNGDLYMQTN